MRSHESTMRTGCQTVQTGEEPISDDADMPGGHFCCYLLHAVSLVSVPLSQCYAFRARPAAAPRPLSSVRKAAVARPETYSLQLLVTYQMFVLFAFCYFLFVVGPKWRKHAPRQRPSAPTPTRNLRAIRSGPKRSIVRLPTFIEFAFEIRNGAHLESAPR